jgi:hypothetical protein
MVLHSVNPCGVSPASFVARGVAKPRRIGMRLRFAPSEQRIWLADPSTETHGMEH